MRTSNRAARKRFDAPTGLRTIRRAPTPSPALLRVRNREDGGITEVGFSATSDAPTREPPEAARENRLSKPGTAIKRMLLCALTALVSAGLLIGGPLLALWVGSRIQSEVGLSMAAVGATIGVLIVTTFLLYRALTFLNAAYDEAVGRAARRRPLPWHKPMSGERRAFAAHRSLSAIEGIVVGPPSLRSWHSESGSSPSRTRTSPDEHGAADGAVASRAARGTAGGSPGSALYLKSMLSGEPAASYDRVVERRHAVVLARHSREAEGLSADRGPARALARDDQGLLP